MNLQPLVNLIRFYRDLPNVLRRISDEAVMSMSDWIIDQNRGQLAAGRDMKNKPLKYSKSRTSPLNASRAYTAAYSKYKQKRGGQTAFVDLKQTGEFYGSLVLDRQRAGVYKILALNNEDLLDVLNKNFTPDILGLNSANMAVLCNRLEAEINRRISAKIAAF